MKTLLLFLLPGGSLLAFASWLYAERQRQRWENEPNYVAAIQSWTPDKPMKLPPIRPLKAQRARDHRVLRMR